MTNIPPGYMLSIRSWENDADNFSTSTLTGLSKADVKFYVAYCNLFCPHQPLGNEDITTENENRLNEEFRKLYEQYKPPSVRYDYESYRKDFPEDCGTIEDYLEDYQSELRYDLIGIWLEGSKYRVFDSFTVHLVEHECQDKTAEFS